MALPPMERVRPRTELHRRGTAARRPFPSNGRAGVELGGRAGGPEDGPGRRLRRGHPAFQDGGSDGEEAERREGGSSSAERLRGADLRGGKLRGPQWLYRQSSSGRRSGWAAGWAEPELLWRGTAARGPSSSNGWAAGDWVGAPEDRRPAFHGRRLRCGHPALQDGGSDCEEVERREGGSSSAERPARSRSAGRKAAGATMALPPE